VARPGRLAPGTPDAATFQFPVSGFRFPVPCFFGTATAPAILASLPQVDLRLALALALLSAIVLAAVILAVTRRWRSWQASTRAQRQARRSIAGEIEAERLLSSLGYRVLARQVCLEWAIACDGEDHVVELRADLLVERRGRRYVAEVKTGLSAPLLTNAATRRQLLEYCVAYDVESVLLVDVEEDRVCEISFPL
jgi:hypothetical protein